MKTFCGYTKQFSNKIMTHRMRRSTVFLP